MIPTLAIAIASMSGYVAANMMGGISGKVTSGVGSAASEAATGSASYGTTQSMGAGFSTSVVNNNKHEMSNYREIGHDYKSINNTTEQNTWEQIYRVNTTTEGDVIINGQTGAGTLTTSGKNGEYARFQGILNGKQVDMLMENVQSKTEHKGEDNQLTTVTGNVVNSYAVSGSSEKRYVNAIDTYGGSSLHGQNAGDEMLKNGIYDFVSQSEQNQYSFLKAVTDKTNAYVSKIGTDSISERQDLEAKINASASAGLDIFGNGFKIGAGGSVSAALGHSSENMSRADLNMAANMAILNGLMADKESGMFNVNGKFSEEKFNEEAQIRFGTYHAMVTGEISNVYGPGNLSSEAIDAIKSNVGKVDNVLTEYAIKKGNNLVNNGTNNIND